MTDKREIEDIEKIVKQKCETIEKMVKDGIGTEKNVCITFGLDHSVYLDYKRAKYRELSDKDMPDFLKDIFPWFDKAK